MTVTLNAQEMEILSMQKPQTDGDGGFQTLMLKLQRQLDSATGILQLDQKDLERIPRYAFDYENGGWQDRLTAIFSRTLGSNLGR